MVEAPEAPKRRRGRPTVAERLEAKKIALEASRGRRRANWGGSRAGSGRPRREEGPAHAFMSVRVETKLAARLAALPQNMRSQWVRSAFDLMADISPPEKFKLPNSPGSSTATDNMTPMT